MGGISTEHEISLETGTTVINALDNEKYNLKPVVIEKSGNWLVPRGFSDKVPEKIDNEYIKRNKDDFDEVAASVAIDKMVNENTDVVFITLHGRYGEDGTIQGLLELARLAFTGSGVTSSATAMNKEKSNEIYCFHGLQVPDYITINKESYKNGWDETLNRLAKDIGFPCIIKPSDGGSSAATFILKSQNEVEEKVLAGFEISDSLMFQKYIQGDEVTCAVLDTEDHPVSLPPTQIIPKTSEFFDYTAKYVKGASEEVTPPRLPDKFIKKAQEIALLAHKILGCSGLSRTDMILKGDEFFVLETNTIPGMTATSLYPQAAAKIGLSFPELLDKLINKAIENKKNRHN